jgi:hypothetical protein
MYRELIGESTAAISRARGKGAVRGTTPMGSPKESPPRDSLEKLAEFTRRILQVRRDELPDKHGSSGQIPDDGPYPVEAEAN